MEILVLAIGNKLLQDEGVGLHVLDSLAGLRPGLLKTSPIWMVAPSVSRLRVQLRTPIKLIVIDAAQLKSSTWNSCLFC